MENLEKALLSELRNYINIDVDTFSKKITIIEKFDIDDTLSDMIHILFYRFNYTVCFKNISFDQTSITYLNSLSWLSNYYVEFLNCTYDGIVFPINLNIIEKISSNLSVKRISIDLGSTDVATIKENKNGFENLKFDLCEIWISSSREIELKHKDIKKLLNNKKKVAIGCKTMTLGNWIKFFNHETHEFKTKRNSMEFQEIKLGFEKFLLLIQ